MASSKTLTPTNVTISIPAMTDVPDASVFSNCVDKEADAINALNSNIAPQSIIDTVTFNVSYESTYSTVRRSGNIVLFNIVFTTPATVTDNLAIATLPFMVAPSLAPLCLLWSGEPCGVARFFNNQVILAASNWLPNRRVLFNAPLIVIG